MAASIDATIGGPSSNSYVTVAEADAYFDGRLDAADWTAASADEKIRALITATLRLEQETYEGAKYRSDPADQRLAWPRAGATDQNGWAYDTDIIPEPVQRAQMELALAMLGSDLLSDTGLEGFEQVHVGPLSITPRQAHEAGDLPRNVRRHIAHVLLSSAGAVHVMRG